MNNSYLWQIVLQICVNALLAGSTYLMFVTGRLVACIGVFMGVGAVTGATLTSRGVAPLVAMSGGALVAATTAAALYLLFARLRGFEFALATIVVAELARVGMMSSDATGGALGFRNVSILSSLAMPLLVAVLALACVVLWERSSSRRAIAVIGEDEQLARMLGIRIHTHRLAAFATAGVIAAIAGFIFIHNIGILEPRMLGAETSIEALAFVIAGGKRSVWGSVIAAAVLTVAMESLRFTADARLVVYGVLLTAMIIIMPEGIAQWQDAGAFAAFRRRRLASNGAMRA
jgi:branched-chain amino acid transport system permease protein